VGHATLTEDSRHAETMVKPMDGQARKAPMAVMRAGYTPSHLHVCSSHHLHGGAVNMADGIGAGAHRGSTGGAHWVWANDAVLSGPLAGNGAAGALAAISRAGGGRRSLVQLLLVAQQEVSSRKASCALGALEELFLGMRTLVPLQVLQPSKGPLAGRANMRARLVGLRGREVGCGLRIDGNGSSCKFKRHIQSARYRQLSRKVSLV